MNTISMEHLSRDYGEGKGIFDISFHVKQGEVFGFLGPNGAGKTTTIRHLMGFLKPKSGTCMINEKDCWKEREKIQKELGYIPGEISFFDDMSGTEFLKFITKYRKTGTDNRQKELLERFELDPKGKIRKMSKGMKQKLGIVTDFLHDPTIMILDTYFKTSARDTVTIPSSTSTFTPLDKFFIPSRAIRSFVIFPAMEATPSTSVAARAAMIATTSSAIFTSPRFGS